MHKGQLKSWSDDKGFGFIRSQTLSQDTFIHISTLKSMSRKPVIGDWIYFEIEEQLNGKTRAVNCSIEGVAVLTNSKRSGSNRSYRSRPSLLKRLAPVLVITSGVWVWNQFATSSTSSNNNEVNADYEYSPPNISIPSFSASEENFTCDGRQYCSEMTSRAEAKFFIQNCPNTKMDGDDDGEPCENDTRF
ncbi:excalibur calcium-binding domain-containing protein [Vibrio algivorus]|uniref:Cold-shock protein n=1 Tax=Vibrio algivorus TaxID=1667024 RepID=A0ABQ6ESF5_9VIBR|nr:excalibur calcium-binding domain-containing protein [Vibrio algivorus]GLT15944.1 cold-shock protein [Vibrio algivorus]